MENVNAGTKIDPRIPLDKAKIMKQFAELPTTMQVALLAGLAAGMATASPPAKPA